MPDLENPLWNFALAFYQREGVAETCLELQNEHGASVNQLLWAIWLGLQGRQLEIQVFADSPARQWREQLSDPLRSLRWQLRSQLEDMPEALEVYKALKMAELASEKVELAHLYGLTARLVQAPAGEVLIRANMRTCLQGVPHDVRGAIAQAEAELLPQARQMYLN